MKKYIALIGLTCCFVSLLLMNLHRYPTLDEMIHSLPDSTYKGNLLVIEGTHKAGADDELAPLLLDYAINKRAELLRKDTNHK